MEAYEIIKENGKMAKSDLSIYYYSISIMVIYS